MRAFYLSKKNAPGRSETPERRKNEKTKCCAEIKILHFFDLVNYKKQEYTTDSYRGLYEFFRSERIKTGNK